MAKRRRVKKVVEKNPPGAPTKLTQELITQVAGYIRIGNYVETAFMACGIPKACFYEWMAKGRLRRGTIYSALTDAVDKAVAEGEVRDVMLVDRAANGVKAEFLMRKDAATGIETLVYDDEGKPIQLRPGVKPDWKAAAWRVERRHSHRWGRSAILEELESIFRPSKTSAEEKDLVNVDAYNIKAIIDKVQSEY